MPKYYGCSFEATTASIQFENLVVSTQTLWQAEMQVSRTSAIWCPVLLRLRVTGGWSNSTLSSFILQCPQFCHMVSVFPLCWWRQGQSKSLWRLNESNGLWTSSLGQLDDSNPQKGQEGRMLALGFSWSCLRFATPFVLHWSDKRLFILSVLSLYYHIYILLLCWVNAVTASVMDRWNWVSL